MAANNIKAVQQVLVDADACPVKREIVAIAREFGLTVWFLASIAHHSSRLLGGPDVHWHFVDKGPQSVDLEILNRLHPGDVVVTQDIGLAALVLGGRGKALTPRGYVFDEATINGMLETRHLEAKARQAGKRCKGPKSFNSAERTSFSVSFRAILKEM